MFSKSICHQRHRLDDGGWGRTFCWEINITDKANCTLQNGHKNMTAKNFIQWYDSSTSRSIHCWMMRSHFFFFACRVEGKAAGLFLVKAFVLLSDSSSSLSSSTFPSLADIIDASEFFNFLLFSASNLARSLLSAGSFENTVCDWRGTAAPIPSLQGPKKLTSGISSKS